VLDCCESVEAPITFGGHSFYIDAIRFEAMEKATSSESKTFLGTTGELSVSALLESKVAISQRGDTPPVPGRPVVLLLTIHNQSPKNVTGVSGK